LHQVAGASEPVLVQVAETLVKRRILADEILAGLVLPQLLLIITTMVLVRYGIKRGLASLERVQAEVSHRSHVDLSPLRADDAPQEVEALVLAINQLMQQLEQVILRQNQFIADAAHQLRTPLAGLKTQAELAVRQTDPHLIAHSLKQLQASSDRMIHLVNQLLLLARAETDWQAEMRALDLVTLAKTVTSAWVPAALAKQIDLGYAAEVAAAPLMGNELLLKEMLNNLVSNAILYTQRGGEITVSVAIAEQHWILAVADNGPGIPPAERELIFERFHRATAKEEGGSGLGLSIARRIARLHGGDVSLREQFPGAVWEIWLPVRVQPAG
jgi:two-component system sensor histidine kinase TctE